MTQAVCPEPHQLEQYLQGRLPPADDAEVEAHFESCANCQGTVADLEEKLLTPFSGLSAQIIATAPKADLISLVSRAKAIDRTHLWEKTATPTTLGQYHLLEQIGVGGMGRVFRAIHEPTQRIVALKLLNSESAKDDRVARFRREAILSARLDHPNVVTIHDAGEEDSHPYLVMELVRGEDLSTRVHREGPLSIEQAKDVICQVAQGLAAAHAAGIVHRDVKPANVLIDGTGTVKLTDLGLARLLKTEDEQQNLTLTTDQMILGTPTYLAPEQAFDPREVGSAADVYSLGCTLFYLLTGEPPYQRGTTQGTMYAHRDDNIPSVRTLREDCPASLDQLCQQMLSKSPDARPSAQQVLEDLKGIAQPATTSFWKKRWTPLFVLTPGVLLVLGLLWLNRENGGSKSRTDSRPATTGTSTAGEVKQRQEKVKVEMVKIPAGRFMMGSPDNAFWALKDEKPLHEVHLSAFEMGKFEITQAQYEKVMGNNPSTFGPNGTMRKAVSAEEMPKLPVDAVNWLDAVRFCNRLSEKNGLKPYYTIEGKAVTIAGGTGYRLPTEAEWEYACRAGTTTRWHFGEDLTKGNAFAWHGGNAKMRPHPVGQKKPNAFGLCDVHGNVPEWCWDRYHPEYYRRSERHNPAGSGIGETRVIRGGGWNHALEQSRSAFRNQRMEHYGRGGLMVVGLRVAQSLNHER